MSNLYIAKYTMDAAANKAKKAGRRVKDENLMRIVN